MKYEIVSTSQGDEYIGILWHWPTARFFATDGDAVFYTDITDNIHGCVSLYYKGRFRRQYYKPTTAVVTRSAMYTELREAAQRMHDKIEAKRCFNVFEEELIQKTWHPLRVMDWCMETD